MTRDEFFKHLQILDRPFEIQPAPQGIINNRFTLGNWSGKHMIVRTEHSQADLFLPFDLIEAIEPGTLKLTKTIRISGNSIA